MSAAEEDNGGACADSAHGVVRETPIEVRAMIAARILDREGQLRLLGNGQWPEGMSGLEILEARSRYWRTVAYLLDSGRNLRVDWHTENGGALVSDFAGVASPN